MELWKNLNIMEAGVLPDLKAESLGALHLLKDILNKSTGHLSSFHSAGHVELQENESTDKYATLLLSKGGRLIYNSIGKGFSEQIFIWEDGIIDLLLQNNSYVSVGGYSLNEAFIKELQSFFELQWVNPKVEGHIYAIMSRNGSLCLNTIGNASIPLESGNYTHKVIEDYNFAIYDLQSYSPSGRIILMEGEPGTGKTHLIRAMLLAVPDAMFVLVSPDMVSSLAGPELLPLLISYKGTKKGPIILVLEDADRCLVTRATDNINSIQSLLNLGDGILGSMLDLRIIATTNAKKLEMEAAILRPGRLSMRIEVASLDLNTARNVFNRLLPNKDLPLEFKHASHFKMTIAEVYSLARKNGWVPPSRNLEKDEDYIENDN